jgi:2-polyprenyl-3-methyl-5-hydroxy-6-metoxy-1,4-benzoquinol methylase
MNRGNQANRLREESRTIVPQSSALDLTREVVALYAPFGWWRQFYARFRLALSRLDQVEQFLPRAGRLLDLGCGYGVVANYLALASPEREVIGIDLDRRRIAVAQRTAANRENITFIAGDVTQVALPVCDTILMTDVLHHLDFKEQERSLIRLYSMLPANGRLLIQEVNTRPFFKYMCSHIADIVLYPLDRPHFRCSADWVTFLTGIGFRQVVTIPGDSKTIFARVSYHAYK